MSIPSSCNLNSSSALTAPTNSNYENQPLVSGRRCPAAYSGGPFAGKRSTCHLSIHLMKKYVLVSLTLFFGIFSAEAKLNVVATLADFGSLARDIGGDLVTINIMAKPTEDPHFVDARPSFVVQLRTADVLIEGGAELEMGWLPPLLQNARNPKIDPGKPGRVNASQGIRLMNVPANVSRAAGDVHALGNPHFMTDPI